jgi:UDP-N-acetylmuramate dehydrogenase
MSKLEQAVIEPTQYRGSLLLDESLAGYTSWRVGGRAKALYKPTNLSDLSLFLKSLSPQEAILWLGLGSNTLIRDKGFNGTVILTQNCLSELELLSEDTIRVEAGVSCAKMARFCARNHLAGGEFWAGIPGTMGGALRMNAGCFNGETWRFVREVETINRYGEIKKRTAKEFNVDYRHVEGLVDGEWFVSATCQLNPGEKEASMQMIKQLLARRAGTQPTSEYNCGSVFRNPPGNYAAQLIESCGLKGMKMGGAKVPEKHANFIINADGQASAEDIEQLIQYVHTTILDKTKHDLIREVHIIGDK